MKKQELFEKYEKVQKNKTNPLKTLNKGDYLVFCCESEGTTILNINDIIEIDKTDEDEDELIIKTEFQNYYPVQDTLTYISV
jgi:hypothetical protein